MTAPDPTAGERASCGCVIGGLHRYECAGVGHVHPPAVAASTGTSEDVEALATIVLIGVTERGNHVTAWQARDTARAVLASDWLAAREAAARAEALRDALAEWEGGPTGQAPIPRWWLEDRAAREAR